MEEGDLNLYRRKRLNITINEKVLTDFKSHSRDNSVNISRFVENKMLEEMMAKDVKQKDMTMVAGAWSDLSNKNFLKKKTK
ncbi:hypothetical protein CL617_04530 [archaeon]|nr:hypothetical protein [archaeon]|tara:strand:- start:16235 stop:16477 length:243 start_codon:yes stop_codon:yes gene_type:complete